MAATTEGLEEAEEGDEESQDGDASEENTEEDTST